MSNCIGRSVCNEPVFLDNESNGVPKCSVCGDILTMSAWRRRPWISRSSNDRHDAVANAIAKFEAERGREPDHDELNAVVDAALAPFLVDDRWNV
jgi:hypothetical protein